MSDDSPWRPPGGPGEPGASLPPRVPASLVPGPLVPPPADVVVDQPVVDGPIVDPGSAPGARSRRSRWFVAVASAAVVAVGAAGVFAVVNLTGATAGGASTPEDLGLGLLQAIENEDVLGVIDVLTPGERDVLGEPLVELVSELTRLEVLSPEADLSKLAGIDVELADERVVATSTNVADIVNVDLAATATVRLDGAALPLGELLTDNMDDEMLAEVRETNLTDTEQLDVRLTAVEEGGRWYFSLLHTVAELARSESSDMPIPVDGIGADGAETPEMAFDQLLDRVEAIDLSGVLRTLNPGEAAALQRYAPLFLDDAEAEIAEVPLRWAITTREFRVDESGDRATVFVDALVIDAELDGETVSLAFADGCLSVEGGDESFEQCGADAFEDDLGVLDDAPAVRELADTVTAALSDIEEVGLELRRTDGLWYVSPFTTGSEAMLAFLRALDRSEIDAIVEQAPAAGEEFFESLFDLDDLGIIDDVGSDDGTGGVFDDAAPLSPGDDCYAETDPELATACFDAAVASGDLPDAAVPVVLRHPECGYQVAWGGELYQLPDDEFIAAAEAARPCFLDLVDRGEIDEFELPTEIAHLECFEGRNWYTVFDDPAYDERYYACLDAAYEG